MAAQYYDPTETTAPVANTTAGLYTFTPPCSHVIIRNHSGETINVVLNTTTAASTSAYDFAIANNGQVTVNPGDYGIGPIKYVGVWFPSGATVGNFNIRGI